jgi:hypothetical protein
MVRSREVDVVEIPTEQLAFVPGSPSHHLVPFDRWSGVVRTAAGAVVHRPSGAPRAWTAGTALRPVGNPGATFRRLIDVPGTGLSLVLASWWRQADHDDGRLRLDEPCPAGQAFSLTGAFRRTVFSRWLPVELLLTPYLGQWTMLELMPRRAVRPNEIYFWAGHRSLDRFVAALRTQVHPSRGAARSAAR